MKRSCLTVLILALLATSATAAQFGVSMLAGQSSYGSDDFKSSTSFGGKVTLASRAGISFEGTAYHMDAESNTTGGPDLKAISVLGGINYILQVRSPIKPYAGVLFGLTALNSSFDSPATTFGYKAGASFRVAPDFNLFAEVSQITIESDVTDIEINPLTIGGGMTILFGGKGRKVQKPGRVRRNEEFRPIRRPKPRGARGRRGL